MTTQPIANFLVRLDQKCDVVPLVSTATNLVAIFLKVVFRPIHSATDWLNGNYFYHHIRGKSFDRCFKLLVPGLGNFIVWNQDRDARNDYLDKLPSARETLDFVMRDPQLADNESFIKRALEINPEVFKHASKRIRDLDEIAEIAVQKKIKLFDHASKGFKESHPQYQKAFDIYQIKEISFKRLDRYEAYIDDEEAVREVVAKRGSQYQYASERLRAREDILLLAMHDDPAAFKHAPLELRDNENVARQAIERMSYLFYSAGPEVQGNRDLLELAMTHSPDAFCCASEQLRGQKDLALDAIKRSKDAKVVYLNMSAALQADPEIIECALEKDKSIAREIKEALDPALKQSLIEKGLLVLPYAEDHIRDLPLIKTLISKDYKQYFEVRSRWQTEPEIVKEAINSIFAIKIAEGGGRKQIIQNALKGLIEKSGLFSKEALLEEILLAHPDFDDFLSRSDLNSLAEVMKKNPKLGDRVYQAKVYK